MDIFQLDPRVSQCEKRPKRLLEPDQVEEMADRFRKLSSDSTANGILRGLIILEELEAELNWSTIQKKTGYKQKTLYKFIQLLKHPRMQRTDWVKPSKWSTTVEILSLRDVVFEALLKANFVNEHTTLRQIRDFVELWKHRQQQQRTATTVTVTHSHPEIEGLNQVHNLPCRNGILKLPPQSIGAVITSPPYCQQRDGFYDGVSAEEYPEWFCVNVMDPLWERMTVDGNVLVVIRAHIEDGQVSDYVMRTRLAVRARGWIECDELVWDKPDGAHLGANDRGRHVTEHILWFSRVRHPFFDLKTCGKPSGRIGLIGDDIHGLVKGYSGYVKGIASITNMFRACMGEIENPDDHPAPYPPTLPRQLVLTYAKPRTLIVDPFAGSGTTCLVAQSLGYEFIGFDNGRCTLTGESWADLASRRLRTEPKYFRVGL